MGVAIAGVFGGWKWLVGTPKKNGLDTPLRSAHEFNEGLWSRLYRRDRRAPEFLKAQAKMPRVNGRIGLADELDLPSYRLILESPNGSKQLSLPEIESLPAMDIVTELCCIEGWSQIVHWTGVPLRHFLETFLGKNNAEFEYLFAETPDGQYFVALDQDAAMHEQTMVCWAMNGKPLEPLHGAPLRLVVPTKYGIKSLKRLGKIQLANQRPTDYWYERGYDWYAGL